MEMDELENNTVSTAAPTVYVGSTTTTSNVFTGSMSISTGSLQISPYSTGSGITTISSSGITIGGSLTGSLTGTGTLNIGLGTEIGREFLEAIIASCEKHPDLALRFYDALFAGPVHGS